MKIIAHCRPIAWNSCTTSGSTTPASTSIHSSSSWRMRMRPLSPTLIWMAWWACGGTGPPPWPPKSVEKKLGVRLVGRAVGTSGCAIVTSDGSVNGARTVIWATGYRSSYPWLQAPVVGPDQRPLHRRGVTSVPGLYFLGLPWQHTRGSALIGWVGRDVAYLADHMRDAGRSGTRIVVGRAAA